MSRQFWSETLAWVTSDGTTINSTGTETIIFPNVTIPANFLQDGRVLRITAYGRTTTASAPTIRWRVRWGGVGGTVVWDSGTITTNNGTAALWKTEVLIQVRSNGSSGTVFAVGDQFLGSAAAPTVASATGAPAVGIYGSAGDDTPAAVTVDLTADTALSLTAQFSTAGSNTLTGHVYVLEALN